MQKLSDNQHVGASFGSFGDRLRAARKAVPLTLRELAAAAHVTGSYVCHLEKGRCRPPSSTVLQAICTATGASADWLLFGGGENQHLTHVSDIGNMSPVKSEMAILRERLADATQGRGKKAELARRMRVTPATISQWLSGSREPGGETTLRLLHWVEAEERKQQSSGDDANTTGAKTQRRNTK